ncbi:response regulator [Chloroflexota bacterium]
MGITVVLADDHKILREGLRSLLQNQPDITVIGEAEDGAVALRMAQELCPNVVIMDIAMPGLNGVDAARQITAKAPSVKVVALSMYADKRFVLGMLKAGARGYLLKYCAGEELALAIRTVAGDHTYLSPQISDIVVKNYVQRSVKEDTLGTTYLTSREREVLQLLAEGKTTKEIAYRLGLSVKTIETYRQQVMNKLGVHSIAELTKYAIKEGLTNLEI